MPDSRTDGFQPASNGALNRIVRCQVAANRSEASELISLLPYLVSNGVEAELDVCKDAHRYDLVAQRAYYFRLDGDRLHIWSWNEVQSYPEAASLLSLVVSLEQELSGELASEVYARAIGRSVEPPQT